MKRPLIVIVPFLLLVLINACSRANPPLPQLSSPQWTAIAQTQAVMSQPGNERIKNWLNAAPTGFDKFDALEQSLIGKYTVTGVAFPTSYYFEVDMNCECTSGSACCVPERMFLLTLEKMASSRDQILADVPSTVQYLDVVCFDHQRVFAAMYAPWDKVKGFLTGVITASDLSSSVTRRSVP